MNVLHFSITDSSGMTAADAQEIADALASNTVSGMYAIWKGHAPDDAVLDSVKITKIATLPFTAWEFSYSGLDGDQIGVDMLPPQNAVVISWRTNNVGRSYRGRTYLPFFVVNQIDALGVLDTGVRDALATAADAFIGAWDPKVLASGRGVQFCIRSAFSNGAPRVPPILTSVTDEKVGLIVDTQRRRRTPSAELYATV